jgi:hypothetical protein
MHFIGEDPARCGSQLLSNCYIFSIVYQGGLDIGWSDIGEGKVARANSASGKPWQQGDR